MFEDPCLPEFLDRDVRKPYERPSIGVLLCAARDNEVVGYALSRTASPALIAESRTQRPGRDLLLSKLHEFCSLAQSPSGTDAPDAAAGDPTHEALSSELRPA